jgi:hypothetical protein
MASNASTVIPERKPFAPADDPKKVTAEQAAKGQETVTMVFAKPVLLSTQDGRRIQFNAGVNEVPKEFADHEWLKHNGVTAYDKNKEVSPWMRANPPAVPPADTVMTEHHAAFLRSRDYTGIKTVADAQTFFSGLDPKHRAGFLADAADWQQQEQAQIQTRVQAGEAGYTEPAPGGQAPLQPHEVHVNTPPAPPRPIQPGEHTSVAADANAAPQLKTAAELNVMSKPDLIAYSKTVKVDLDPAAKKEDMVAKLMATQNAHK